MLRCIAGVGVGPSPVWMRRALESVGSRSIDNVVDATNYVLRELGHPLHAFDADRIRGGRIVVRRAKEGEAFTALDDRELKLSAEDLVIADAEGPIALAGVIGGRESEVTEATENVALECACFDPISIRRTARRHGFSTDASHRFERGTDRIGLVQSLERTAYFIQKLAGGVIARAPLDEHHAPENPPAPIELSVEKVNRHLGLRLDSARIADCLRRLQFRVDPPSNGSLRVSPPSFRLDARQDVDLIEEVARIHGYENIPETIPAIAARADAPADRRGALESDLRALLLGRGFCEAIHYSFISDDEARRVGFDPAAQPRLANPISADQVVMRPSLLPGLIAAAERNRRQGADSIRLFEIGRVYRGGAQAGDESAEPARLGLILAGATPVNWAEPSRPFDFHDMKGAVEAIGGTIGLGAPRVERLADSAILHPGRAASVRWMGRAFGVIGELHPDLTEAMKTRACVALLDLEELLDAAAALSRRFAAIPNLPGSERDFALIVDESLAARDLIEAAAAAGKPLLERVEVIDLYRGGHVPDGKKSLALRFTLRSPETTLTDAQINEVMRRIQAELETRCGATLRT
jgi:phenylalanyl-tRNA synthetase beta chain